MKKTSLVFSILILIVLTSLNGYSQTRHGTNIGAVEWSMAFNSGRASDLIDGASFSGASLYFKRFVQDNLAIGITFNWNAFSEEQPDGFTEFPNGAVSGAQAKYLNYIPMIANVGYYFNQSKKNKFIPYIQANVGAYYVGQRVQLGINQIDNDNWHFGLGPELGFLYVMGTDVFLSVNGKYNYVLSAGTNFRGEDENDFAFINANIGIGYYMR